MTGVTMKTKWLNTIQVFIVVVFLLGASNLRTVLAQDEITGLSDSISTEVETTEPVLITEVPVSEMTTETSTPTSIPIEIPTEVMTVVPETPTMNIDLGEVVKSLDESNIVVADEINDRLPMASQQAEEALQSSDPFFWDGSKWVGFAKTSTGCPVGVICNVSTSPFQDAVNAAPENSTIYVGGAAVIVGVDLPSDIYYNEDVLINKSGLSFIGFNAISIQSGGLINITTNGYAIVKSITLNENIDSASGVYTNQVFLTNDKYVKNALNLLNASPITFELNKKDCTSNQDFIDGWCVDKKIEWCHCENGNGCHTISIDRSGVNGHDKHIGDPNHVGENAGPCEAPEIPPCSVSGAIRDDNGECVLPTLTITTTATVTETLTVTTTVTATETPTTTVTTTATVTETPTETTTVTATETPTIPVTTTTTVTETPTETTTVTATETPTIPVTTTTTITETPTEATTVTATETPTIPVTTTTTVTEAPTITTIATATETPAVTSVITIDPIIPITGGGNPSKLIIPVTGGQLIPVTGGTLIVSGLGHSCMTYNGSQVICWGLNASGQLGDGTNDNKLEPVYVKDLEGVQNLTAGGKHTCALTIDGEIWCWGENSSGQLGNGTTQNSSVPVKVTGLPDKVLSITAGEEFTCAQLMNQEVWCWGKNNLGQLNDGTTTNQTSPVKSKLTTMLAQISGGQGLLLGSDVLGSVNEWVKAQAAAVKQLASSLSISANRWGATGCAVASDGSVKCWGSDLISIPVTGALPAMEVGTGLDHNCSINSDESVSCWGSNGSGQLGNGTNKDSEAATLVKNLTKARVLAVGAHHTCILSGTSNIAMCWGENTYGQLGNNTTTNSNMPVLVIMPAIQ
jgi:hypothetical protein